MLDGSFALLGVANIEDVGVFPSCDACDVAGVEPNKPVPGGLELEFEVCPKLNPPDAGLLEPPNTLLPPPVALEPLVEVPLPNRPAPLVGLVLLNRPPPEEAGVFDVEPKRPADGA